MGVLCYLFFGDTKLNYIDGLVSVIIPTYKRADTVLRAVESVLAQTYPHIECIVVNDNNPGDEYSNALYETLSVIADARLRILDQPSHKNGAAARNFGIRNSKGEYVAFLDDDDWWKIEKIEKQVELFAQLDDHYAIVSTLVEFYKDGIVIRKTKPYKTDNMMIKILEREVEVTTPSILVRHKAIEDVGMFDENLKRHQEIQFLSCITNKYKFSLIHEYLTCVGIEDSMNKPTIKQLQDIKSNFFESVDHLLVDLPKREQRCIKCLHRLEIVYRKIQEGMFFSALKDCVIFLSSPSATLKALRRVTKRLKENR